MSAEDLAVAEGYYVAHLTNRVRQGWLAGYASTWAAWADVTTSLASASARWPRWMGAEIPLRIAVFQVTDVLLAALGPGPIPEGFDPEILRVQVCHVLRDRELPPIEAARRALALAGTVPRTGDARELEKWAYRGLREDPAELAWARILLGAVFVPGWGVMIRAWAGLTAGVREMLGRVVGPTPAALDSARAFAWLDWAANRPVVVRGRLMEALGGLTPEEAERVATVAIEQHEAWMACDLVHRIGSNPDIARAAYDFLLELRAYYGTLSQELEARIRAADIRINADRYDPAAEDDEDEPYFPGGFMLLPASEVADPSRAVRAGHGEWLRVNRFAEPLLILLDLDLTRPELAFLGLEGTRLVFCDWAAHGRKTCYTRVGLDGSVKLMRRSKGDEDDSPPEPGEPLVLGPAFDSPVLKVVPGYYFRNTACLGGKPAWEQEPEVPRSPDSRDPMTFVAQFPHPNGGTAYAFLDPLNLIAAVVTQYD